MRVSRQRFQHVAEELIQIEQRLTRPPTAGPDTMTDFLRLTLHNFASSVLDLERATALLGPNAETGPGLQTVELLAALRHAVEVLEKTKQNFKSKELGQLRYQLQTLLDPRVLPAKPGAPPVPPSTGPAA